MGLTQLLLLGCSFIYLFPHPKTLFSLLLQREKHGCDRETLISCLPYAPGPRIVHSGTSDPTPRLGMSPNQELNLQPFGARDDTPTNGATLARARLVILEMCTHHCFLPGVTNRVLLMIGAVRGLRVPRTGATVTELAVSSRGAGAVQLVAVSDFQGGQGGRVGHTVHCRAL